MHVRVMFALCAMGLVGCYNWRAGVSNTASLQHQCPAPSVRVVNDNGDEYARVVELDVCGERRVYQDLGGSAGYAWVDQTPRTETARSEDATETEVASAVASAEGLFPSLVRSRIDAARANVLACTGGPTAVVAEWTEGPVRISVRGESDVAVAQCVASAIGTIEVPRGTVQGRLIHPVAP